MKLPKSAVTALLVAILGFAPPQFAHAQAPDFSQPQGRVLDPAGMLLAGAEANRFDVVLYLLNKGADPDAPARNGYTALIVASAKGNAQIIDLLLARGADVNKANDSGWTALMEAALSDQDNTVRRLLKAGAKVDVAEQRNGQTPLIVAAKSNRPDSTTAILDAGADVNSTDTAKGLSALHHALASTKGAAAEIAAELLVRGADPSIRAKDGYTPLMSAVDSGTIAKLSLVLSESVDVNAATKDGRTALTIAAGLGHASAVKRLVSAGATPDTEQTAFTALTQAARAGSADTLKVLLEAGADPNRPAKDGRMPLMLAVRSGFDEAVNVLVEKGAAVNGRNLDDGSTALMWAANNGFQSIVDRLVENGADPALAAKDGWTAGEAARMAGHTEIAKKLERQI